MRSLVSFIFILCIVSFARAEDKTLSVSAETFGQLPAISGIKLSPDGTRYAMFQNFRGRKVLVTMSYREEEKGAFHILTFAEGEYRWFRWLSNDRLAVSIRFPAKRFGSETMETRLIATDWNKENIINMVKTQRVRSFRTTGGKWVSQFQDDVISFLPDDPDHVLLGLDSYEDIGDPDVYKVNIHDADRSRIQRSRSNVHDWYADQKGVVRLGVGTSEKGNRRLLYRGSEDDGWKTIARYDLLDEDMPFEFEEFSSDPNIIFVSTRDDEGRRVYYKYDLEAEEFGERIAHSDAGDVDWIDIDEDGKLVSYHYEGAKPVTVYTDKRRRGIARFLNKQFPGQSVSIESVSKDKKKYIILISSPQNPGDYYLLDLQTKKLDWFAEKYPGLDRAKLSVMEPITYTARDGLEIPGYLSLPPGKELEKLPTVILPHGGPFARDTWRFDYWVQLLTTRGYAVLQMNYRGSTGFGQDFRKLGEHEWGGKMLKDINDGARWMIEQGYADPDNICIMGGSYGGYAALHAPIVEPGLYKCSVALAPVTDLRALMWDERNVIGHRIYKHYITSDELSYSDMSPKRNIDKIDFPVLVAHGTKDRSVPFDQGEDFADDMEDEDKDITFLKFEDGDHYLSRQEHRVAFLKAVEKFLAEHLGGQQLN